MEAVINSDWHDTGRFIVDTDKNVGQVIIKINQMKVLGLRSVIEMKQSLTRLLTGSKDLKLIRQQYFPN